MNRFFDVSGGVKLTRLAGKGKLEAFIVPTNAMNSSQAHQIVRNTIYDPSKSSTASYDYLDKSLGLYIDGSVKPFTIEHGEYIHPYMKTKSNFE